MASRNYRLVKYIYLRFIFLGGLEEKQYRLRRHTAARRRLGPLMFLQRLNLYPSEKQAT